MIRPKPENAAGRDVRQYRITVAEIRGDNDDIVRASEWFSRLDIGDYLALCEMIGDFCKQYDRTRPGRVAGGTDAAGGDEGVDR